MNVASLELCKELYELSPGDATYLKWAYDPTYVTYPIGDGEWFQSGIRPHTERWTDKEYYFLRYCPAYDLGYLLRKLPEEVEFTNKCDDEGAYRATFYNHSAQTKGQVEAPSPEDALCQLAIELFKQGILKKES